METKSFYKTITELEEYEASPIPYSVLEEQFDIDKISGLSWQTEGDVLLNITIIFEKEDNNTTESISANIIEILGDNHTDPIQFNNVNYNTEVYGLYTYCNSVYVFKKSVDMSFEDLTLKEQKKIKEMFNSNDWKINKALQ